MDITEFMSWFVNQVVNMFSWFFNLLDSITFAGTSVLKVLIALMILSPLLAVVLTLSSNVSVIASRSEKVRENKERREHNDEKNGWI